MTILIALYKENFAMIATDTRITLLDQTEKPYDDNYSKLCSHYSVWLAGIGYGPLVTTFRSNVESNNTCKTEQFEPIFRMVCNNMLQTLMQPNTLDPNQIYWLLNTTILFTLPYQQDGVFHMTIKSLNFQTGQKELDMNKVSIFPPGNFEDVNQLIQIYEPLIESSSNLDELVYTIARLIKEVSHINQGISNICDFGFLIKDPKKLLLKVNIKEPADIIIEAYNKNCLSNYWKVISEFPLP